LKHSQREVGELKAYIDELEHNIKELGKQLQRQQEEFNKYKKQNSQKIDISALHEAAHRVKSEEMYKGMKSQNKKLRNELKMLRKSKNELLHRMAQVGYMKKNELSKALEEERLRREQLGNLASSAVTEEERERYHNEIVDCESVIQSLEEDLKMYD
jgi:chromosome segregation ATPase